MKVKSKSEVAQSCPTLSNPMDCSAPVFSIHEIFQARVLEWGAIAFSEEQVQVFHKRILKLHLTSKKGSATKTRYLLQNWKIDDKNEKDNAWLKVLCYSVSDKLLYSLSQS